MKINNRTRVLLKRDGPISNRSAFVYGKVANFLVTFSVFFGRLEEHQKFVAEVKLNWDSTKQSP